MNMTTTEIIEAMGYPTEIHHLHRIPHGINRTTGGDRPVALLQHCLLCSSADYIMNTPDQALAYVLADAGYDVWMPNFRGNTYSTNHVELDPADIKFWAFSWDDMAVNDVPNSIDYILATTGHEDLYYVGWSMGTTAFWAMMSELPEYNNKVRDNGCHGSSGLPELCPWSSRGAGAILRRHRHHLNTAGPENWCDSESIAADICYNFLFIIAGPDSEELNEEFLPVILSHTPAGSSVHTFNHYAQTVMSGKFQKYDYGLLGNLNHYGQNTPPLYNLSAVTAPIGLFWGQTDWIAPPQDVARLADELPNVALNHRVDKDEFNHLDFGWCKHPYEYVNRHVVDFLAKF
ncbi:hypothetical protein O3P69_002493 [Scylla paramamosain]|uniref:AB hydrolase-1 domain-containing protein n=1 Tax=Scylla paramamosain TaxID=85552 RepID=A0AAW0UPF2_SCYPA